MKDPNNPNCDCACHRLMEDDESCVCGCRVHYGTNPKDAEKILSS